MARLLNPNDISLSDFQQQLRFLETASESIVISKKSTEAFELGSLEEALDSERLLWLSSSGSFQKQLVGLSNKSLLNSAASVNEWLEISTLDTWAIALPLQHIASIAILYRSLLSECKIKLFEAHWNTQSFSNFLESSKATICSLVPTQIFDLLKDGVKPSQYLRAVIVGGASIDEVTFLNARKLGWPLLLSYGLTECASQVACAALDSLSEKNIVPELIVLPHLEVSTDNDSRFLIKGSSILSKSIMLEGPKALSVETYARDATFRTLDFGSVDHGSLKITGRADRSVKVKGSFIHLQSYEELVSKFNSINPVTANSTSITFIATAVEDQRDGHKIVLCYHGSKTKFDDSMIIEKFNTFLEQEKSELAPVSKLIELEYLPILENRKINYSEVQRLVTQRN